MNDLIFDLGMHTGEDTEYYLSLGYKVIAVEANPFLCEKICSKLEKFINDGSLIICNRALCNVSNTNTDFYINTTRPEISSMFEWIPNSQDGVVEKVKVLTTTLEELIKIYGIPYYIKCDVEGMDVEISKQLAYTPYKDIKYVSFEINKNDYFSVFHFLRVSGYNSFQIVNQIHNEVNSSGVFGDQLPKDGWLSFNEAFERYMKYRELKIIDNVNLGVGWVDLHARRN